MNFFSKLSGKSKAIVIAIAVFLVIGIFGAAGSDTEDKNLAEHSTFAGDSATYGSTAVGDVESESTTVQNSSNETDNDSENLSAPTGNYKASLSSIPSFSGKPYVNINGGVPGLTAADRTSAYFEIYSPLDEYGRCGVTFACLGKETMPTEERGEIGSVKPSGWHTVKYDCVDGKYLYNRCHLIGFQLSGENANTRNLITGTRYMNVDGMLPFENMVADYIKETGNHVLYRVTPIFKGDELVARGVQMEAYSVEDEGDGICFNVYCYNNQPDVTIDYSTGESSLNAESTKPQTTEPSVNEPDTTQQNTQTGMVWVSKTGKKYHSHSGCSNMKNPSQVTVAEADARGLTPCSKCW